MFPARLTDVSAVLFTIKLMYGVFIAVVSIGVQFLLALIAFALLRFSLNNAKAITTLFAIFAVLSGLIFAFSPH